MSILRVDKIFPFQSSSVEIFGDVRFIGPYNTGSFTGSFIGDGSGLTGIMASTDTGSFATTGSNSFVGNQTISGSVTISGSIRQRGIGEANTFIGDGAGLSNNPSRGTYNTYIGVAAGATNTIGQGNLAIGPDALNDSMFGDNNIAIGSEAGRFAGGGNHFSPNESIFIGIQSQAQSDNQTNQIVIGSGAIGNGSNTVTIGNTSITSTTLRGRVSASLFSGSFVGDGSGLTGIAGVTPIETGSFATTGSNNFVGNQTITGSLTVSGSSTFTNIGPTILSGSVNISGSVNADRFQLDASSTANIPALNSTFNLDLSGSGEFGGINFINKTLVLGDGKILIAGRFQSIDGHTTNDIARLNSNGTVDTSFTSPIFGYDFGSEYYGYINTFATQSDNKILAGGTFTEVDGDLRYGIARLNSDGTLDASFAAQSWGTFGEVRDIAIQNDGKIVCVGEFTSGSRRINTNGTLDTSFNVSTGSNNPSFFNTNNFYSVALLTSGSDQAILIGGSFTQWGSLSDFTHIVKLHPSGALDSGFAGANLDIATPVGDRIQKIKVGDDGYVYVAGRFRDTGIGNNAGFARITTADEGNGVGAIDTGFRTYITNSFVNDFDFYDSDKILLGGSFTTFGNPSFSTTSANRFVIIDQNDGGLVTNWISDGLSADYNLNNNFNTADINSVTLLPNDNVLLGGTFISVNSTAREGLASLKLAGFGDVTTTTDYSITADTNQLLINSSNTQFSGDVNIFGNLTANQYIVSSSVSHITTSFSSGSTQFGDSAGDTHQFTGSVLVKGDQTISGSLFLSGSANDNFIMRDVPLAATPTGFVNTIIGVGAGKDITSGGGNIFLGYQSGFRNTSGDSNTFIGVTAGYYTVGADQNSFVGYQAGEYNQAADNTSLGYRSLRNNISGVGNVSIGSRSGERTRSGGENGSSTTSIFIGNDARPDAMSQTNQIVIGATAIGNGSNTVVLGNTSITSTTLRGRVSASLFSGSFVGDGSGLTGISTINTGSFATTGSNTFVGNQIVTGSITISGSISQVGVGSGNTFLGASAAENNTTGYQNTFVGRNAGLSNTEGFSNTFLGNAAGLANILGGYNVAIGDTAASSQAAYNESIFIGYNAQPQSNLQTNQIVVGFGATGNGSNTVVLGNTSITSTTLRGSVSASVFSGSFIGDGSGLTGIPGVTPINTGSFATTGSNTFVGNQTTSGSISQVGVGDQSIVISDAPITTLTSATGLTAIGFGAGESITTGYDNTFIGNQAGRANTTGFINTFVGAYAGAANTSGTFNTFIGRAAGQFNTTSGRNTFVGTLAGQVNTGASNTFLGTGAGMANTTAGSNTFVGNNAGLSNTTAGSNTFVGNNAGATNSTAQNNTFVGEQAGRYNTSGSFNTFIGMQAGWLNSTAASNTYVGYGAGQSNTSGSNNTFIGASTGQNNTLGDGNTFIGHTTGYNNSVGTNNVFMGRNAGFSNTSGSNNTFVGNFAGLFSTTAGNNAFFGFNAGKDNSVGTNNTFVGPFAGEANISGSNNTFVGNNSGLEIISGSNNSFFGNDAGRFIANGSTTLTFASASVFLGTETKANADSETNQIVIGHQAIGNGSNTVTLGNDSITATHLKGDIMTSGSILPAVGVGETTSSFSLGSPTAAWKDIWVSDGTINFVNGAGVQQGALSTTANGLQLSGDIYVSNNVRVGSGAGSSGLNTVVGAGALQRNTTGTSNTAMGSSALSENSVGTSNTALGILALAFNTSGSSNTAVGASAMYFNGTGGFNTAIGHRALYENRTGLANLSIGYESLFNLEAGSNNIAIGYQAGRYASGSSSSNIYIGRNAGSTSVVDETGKLYIDIQANDTPLIGGNFIGREVSINGQLDVNGNQTTNGSVLISGSLSQIGLGSGNIIFTDTPITTLNATAPLGIQNTIVGSDAGQSITDGYSNSFFGRSAGRDTTIATNNTFIGLAAGQENISGSSNTFLGSSAGQLNKASLNTFVGNSSGNNNTLGTSNTFVGHNSGVNTSVANDNTFIGSTAGALNQSGSSNTVVGAEAAYSNEGGVGNSIVGFQAGRSIEAGSYNTMLGFRAGRFQPNYISELVNTGNSIFIGADASGVDGTTNQIVIGYNAVGNGTNTVTIGNNEITDTYLKGTLNVSTAILAQVSASFNFADDTAAAGGGVELGGLYHTSGSIKIRLV
jgi:uncharacterized delta-60 repeat protein